ncbi:MAG: hypothetical protein AVDCRST_MAG56-2870, partial [uncultured Cytophagales bacterium]
GRRRDYFRVWPILAAGRRAGIAGVHWKHCLGVPRCRTARQAGLVGSVAGSPAVVATEPADLGGVPARHRLRPVFPGEL